MDGQKINESHVAFKISLPNYENGETSNTQNEKGKTKVNYSHAYDNVVNIIIIKEKMPVELAHVIT